MGVSSALAYLIRSEGFGLIALIILFLLYRGWLYGRLGKGLVQLALLFLGFVLFAAPYMLYLKQDTGNWLISRKAGFILYLGLADHDLGADQVTMKDSDRVSIVSLISSRPLTYAKKVFIDAFRSLGVYFEAVHYSYLPFLFVGGFFFFRGRFWEKDELLLAAIILFYVGAFSLLYVNRRYAVQLVPLSLGWVAVGYLALQEYSYTKWERRGAFLTGIVLVSFLAGTLPKTLQAIGQEKLYLREAGRYLKEKPGNPIIITNNARVAFYAGGENRVLVKESEEIPSLLAGQGGDFFAVDEGVFRGMQGLLERGGWLLDREFSDNKGERLFVLSRR
jgi:hypothetical protein